MTFAAGDDIPDHVIDPVDPEAMKLWSGFLADPNPIHLDAAMVSARGLGNRVINQGPINVAYMMDCLMQAFPGGQIEKMTTRFLDNVYGGERVVARGKIVSVTGNRIHCTVQLDSDERGTVNSAEAIVAI